MIMQGEVEQIKKLIKDGFDIELISFELDIPIEQLKQYEKELNDSKKNSKTYSAKELIDKKNRDAHLKIEQMRERYKKLFFENNREDITMTEQLSEKDIEQIERKITTLKEKIQEIKSLSGKDKIEAVKCIILELEKLEEYKLLLGQSEELYNLISSEELKCLSNNKMDKINNYINIKKKRIAKQFANAIDEKCKQEENIDELKDLKRKLTLEIEKESPIYISAVKSRIANKILAVQQQNARNKIRMGIPVNIESIIEDFLNGKIDIQKINEIIDEEARKRVESKPKNKFSLTQEQERKSILKQIEIVITEKADKYQIQNSEKAVLQLQQLGGDTIEYSLRVIVKNLIARKKFSTAKSLCDTFSSKDEENKSLKFIKALRNEIRNSEISDMVLTLLNMNGTVDEERAYINVIQKGLRIGNVKLEAVSLGKTNDGSKNITLADIWIDENQIGEER